MVERPHLFSVPMSREEIAKVHALADARDEAGAAVIRKLVATAYADAFGDKPPPPVVLRGEKRGRKPARGTR
jgi:hypothetical protein